MTTEEEKPNPPFGHRNPDAKGKKCFQCGREAYGRGNNVWLCRNHLRISRKWRPFRQL